MNYFVKIFTNSNITLKKYGQLKFFVKLFIFFNFLFIKNTNLIIFKLNCIRKISLEFFEFIIKKFKFYFILFQLKQSFGFLKLKKKKRLKKKIKKRIF